MKIILTARDEPLAQAWEKYCGDCPSVEIYRGSILDLRCDAIVSPANSFGFMDGGIDRLYSDRFGWQLQARLQKLIQVKYHGELLVGQAAILETDNVAIPYVIAAPTMRVPMILPQDTVNPYLASRSVFLLIKYGRFEQGILAGEKIADGVQTVAFPGLATGIGQVSPESCARQMRQAIEAIVLENHQFPRSWSEAQIDHQFLYGDAIRDLQQEN